MKFTHLAFILCVLGMSSCSDCGRDDILVEEEITQYRTQLGYFEEDIIAPGISEASQDIELLNNAVESFLIAPTLSNLANVQQSHKNAWISFQQISFLRFGPGEFIIPQLNTFPADAMFLQNALENGEYVNPANDEKGLPALDWLLNEANLTADELLTAFTNETTGASRMNVLSVCSNELVANITALESAWQSNYAEEFRSNGGAFAGAGMSLYINSFVQDYELLKRDKVALPLGLLTLDIPLPDKVEAYHGGYSVELALQHLTSLRKSIDGFEGRGLKALLDELGAYHDGSQMDLSDAILTAIQEAQTALEQVPDPLSDTIDVNPQIVQEAYDELQEVVVLLKVDLPSALGISITFTDNDGD
ncbi:MAG: imelysin family protein [Flavobacteriales bacterium]|nr:imelysin family protein [Flavobacteriales bacterium]